MDKLSREAFKFVESEVYRYEETKQLAENIRQEILHSTPVQYEIRGTDVSDPTGRKGVLIYSHRIREKLLDRINAIEDTLDELDKEMVIVLKQKYFEEKDRSWEAIAEENYIGKSTIYRWREHFIYEVALKLGIYK